MTLSGKTLIITGASRGIGAATAIEAARRGANVVLSARDRARLNEVGERISGHGGKVLVQRADVTKEAEWTVLFDAAIGQFGAVHGLVNNAGVHLMRRLEEYTLEDYRWLTEGNVLSVMLGVQEAFRRLPAFSSREDKAAIVNVSSTAGLMGASFQTLYNMTKGAVQIFTKSAAQEAIDRRLPIRVNSVNPGMVDTDMGDHLVGQLVTLGIAADEAVARKNLTRGYMDRRFATADEVARAICFLVGPEASFTTGDYLTVDGGFTNA